MSLDAIAILVGWGVLAVIGGIAVGKLFGRVKAVEDDNRRLKNLYQDVATKEDLETTALHQESLTKSVGRQVGDLKEDVRDIQGDIKTILRELPKLNGGD